MSEQQIPQDGLGPVSRESTATVIARQLRNAIQAGALSPGKQLGERDLAQRMAVSRGPLREAMQRLVQEGLLRSEPNRGLFVIELDSRDVYDIYLARTAIERAAAATILDNHPARSVKRLRRAHRQMVTAADRGDFGALTESDLAFHQILVDEAESPRLKRMHDTLLVETRICLQRLGNAHYVPDELVVEHGAIVEAIETEDRERLSKLITGHANDALAHLTPDDAEQGKVITNL